MTPAEPREYALYLRESKGYTAIPRQRARATAHVTDQGGRVTAEFSDKDKTAFRKEGAGRPERPGFDALLEWAQAHPGAGIAAYHADRLLRDPEDTELLIRTCRAGGHLIETYRGGGYDLSKANGRKRLRQDALDATYEVDHNTERILDQKKEAAEAGRWLGSMRPFGYEGIPAEPGSETKYLGLRVVPAEAAAIRSAAEEVLDGTSLHSVVARWDAEGITGTTGGTWTVSNLRRLLMNPRYAGIAVHRGKEVGQARWEPILPLEVSLALQVKLGARSKPGHSVARVWLGSGLYLCGVCDRPVHVRGVASSSGRDKSYCCPLNHVGRVVRKVDVYVTQLVLSYLEQQRAGVDIAEALSEGRARGEDVTLLKAEIVRWEARRGKLGEQYVRGIIGDEELAVGSATARDEIRNLERRIAGAGRVSPLASVAGDPDIRERWLGFDVARKQAIIGGLITVRIHPAGPGRPKGIPWPEGWFDERLIEVIPKPGLRWPSSKGRGGS